MVPSYSLPSSSGLGHGVSVWPGPTCGEDKSRFGTVDKGVVSFYTNALHLWVRVWCLCMAQLYCTLALPVGKGMVLPYSRDLPVGKGTTLLYTPSSTCGKEYGVVVQHNLPLGKEMAPCIARPTCG
jgi:hypothetical protein